MAHTFGAAGIGQVLPRLRKASRQQTFLYTPAAPSAQLRLVREAVSSSSGFGAADVDAFGGASARVTPRLPAPSAIAQAGSNDINAVVSFLDEELKQMFAHGDITASRYDPQISFEDPVVRLKGRSAYAANLRLLRALFDIDFVLHQTQKREPNGIVTWWTMALKPRFILWQPVLTLTGQSQYTVDPSSGLITSHTDTWDSLEDNSYFSMEALALLLRGLLNARQTSSLDGPKYTVLRAADYQVRRYDPYLVAEVAMPSGSGAAAGDGFNDLAGYIFGGNNRGSKMEMTSPVYTSARQDSLKMEMTSPVFTTANQQANDSDSACGSTMSFPMEARFGLDPEMLPTPNDTRVTRRLEEEKLVAAIEFDGWPLEWQVRAAERQLRGALALDGIEAADGYMLARYNDPFTLPQFRRNEVLIGIVENFEFP